MSESTERRRIDPAVEEYIALLKEDHAWRREEMPKVIADGLASGVRQLLADDELVKKFWKRGFDEITGHSTNGASQWVGKRILTVILGAIFATAIVWSVKTGAWLK